MFLLQVAVTSELMILSILTSVRSCERSRFDIESSFNDLLLFENLILGPPSNKSKVECAEECHRNQTCTTFSISLDANICQLYVVVQYPDVAAAQAQIGRRYYTSSLSLLHPGFTFLGPSQTSIQIVGTYLDYTDAANHCSALGARLLVLEEADKANAVIDIIQNMGDSTKIFLLGAKVEGTHPNFVWADGRPVTRDWWRNGEPDNAGEHCVGLKEHGILDIPCLDRFGFICEITQ